jgi:hypothetical protein
MREIDGILYCNDGDWVESLTALAETLEGELKIIHWTVMHSPDARTRSRQKRAALA